MAKYLDYAGLAKYDSLIKAFIKKGDDDILAFIGELPDDASEATTVIDYLVGLINENGGDALAAIQEINNRLGAFGDDETRTIKEILAENASAIQDLQEGISSSEGARIDALEAALDILAGDGEGSIDKKIEEAINGVVDGAPEAFDTLKEIAAWIGSDTTGAADLISRVGALEAIHEAAEADSAIDLDDIDALFAGSDKA